MSAGMRQCLKYNQQNSNKFIMNYPSSPSSQSHSISHQQSVAPKKQQWALINQYKALEFQRLKQLQKTLQMDKKRHFKQQLDNQINSKSDVHYQEKQADRKYYQYITKKTSEMKEREQIEKYNKFMKRKQVQQQNQYYLDHMRNSRNKSNDPGYHLDIGVKSQQQRRHAEQQHKKQMLDTLDKQMMMKAQQKRKLKMNSLEADQANLKYQLEQYQRRKSNGKRFGQNQNVYNYYKNLDEEKRIRERQLQHRLIDQAAVKKMQQEDYKRYIKQREKAMLTNQMKNTLDLQIDITNQKHQQQRKVNPEQHTYSVIGGIFKDKPIPYNKVEYSQYLKKQAEQAAQRKKKQTYMSEQQYRINMNQLNRAVSGTYAHQKYIDRSVGAIGDNKKINLTQMNQRVNDEDSEVVRQRLESLKQRPKQYGNNDSYLY